MVSYKIAESISEELSSPTKMITEPKLNTNNQRKGTSTSSCFTPATPAEEAQDGHELRLQAKQEAYDKLYNVVKEWIQKDIDANKYAYHNTLHTFEDVLPQAERLARGENLTEEEVLLVKTAALLHDTGFLFNDQIHEEVGVQLVQQVLPQFGYSAEEIEKVQEMIRYTQMPQRPPNKFCEIICDSDLSYLGCHDDETFMSRIEGLRNELANSKNLKFPEQKWLEMNVSFIGNHKYFTKSARDFYDETKKRRVEMIKALVAKGASDAAASSASAASRT